MGYLATKVNWWLHMTLSGYDGSTNGRTRVSWALPDDRNEASERGVRKGCVVVSNIPHECPYICMEQRPWEAEQPTNTRASAIRATTTQPGFAQPYSALGSVILTTYQLPVGTHGARTSKLTTSSYTATRAGRAPLADREPRLSPTQTPPHSTSML